MTEEEIKKFYSLCDSLDIRKFTLMELGIAFAHMEQEILIGLKRKGKSKTFDGGLPAIDTLIKPITQSDLEKIPAETQVLYGAYAGTNWVTGVATKSQKSIIEQHLATKSFLKKKNRRFKSREDFAKMIAIQIEEALTMLTNNRPIQALAISFGFPQQPINTAYGRDCLLPGDKLTKSWYIKNGFQMPVGKYLLQELKKLGITTIKKVYFANDTTAVALDISAKFVSEFAEKTESLPIGFVMGTGDNGGGLFKGFKNNNLVNLEVGSSEAFGRDLLLDKMISLKITPNNTKRVEYYMGGDYLLGRLAVSLLLIQENKFVVKNYFQALLSNAPGAKVTSRLAARDITAEELSDLLKITVTPDELFVLNEAAKRILAKAGQVAGVMVSVICQLAGWSDGVAGAIPVEGTVFSQGFGFRESIRRTMKLFIPKHQLVFVPGSGTRGIATEAMIKSL